MNRPVAALMAARMLTLLVLLALLGGCAMVRMAYNNAEPLVRYNANEYFDLNEKQNEQFRTRLLQFHDWHRTNELPLYADLLKAAAQRVGKGITREDAAWAAAEIRSRYSAVMIKAVNDAAPILASLSPEQITELEKRLVKGNEKFARDFLPADEDERFRAQAKRLVGRFKDWTGTLSDGQEDRIERFVKAHLSTTQMRFENRKRWQSEAVGLIRQVHTPGELAPRLADIFLKPADHRLPGYVRALVRWESDLTDLILDIERTLTPEQRAHVLQRMQRYVDDFEALAAQGSVAATAAAPGTR